MLPVTVRPPLTLDSQLDVWRAAGRAAFHRGQRCVPALDADVMRALAGVPVGDPRTVPALDAWSAGWTAANLDAPVDGEPCPLSTIGAHVCDHA